MKKLKKKAFSIDTVIYPCILNVGILDVDLFINMLRENLDDSIVDFIEETLIEYKNSRTSNAMYIYHMGIYCIFIFKQPDINNSIYSTITHEVFHITETIMDNIGMSLNKETVEAYCYLNGYINEKILENI